ncbi:MAG: acyl-CoA dehydrogenase, partial [Alphaproteobacteria bacterium]|nr:acyl-CoA dehydrogenase [Alphaproteobacteria bacterium]
MPDRSFFAWPFFADHHRRLADDIGEWAGRVLEPQLGAEHDDVEAAAIRYAALLGEAGFLRYVVPKAYGGAHEALDVRSICLIRETLARYSGVADVAFAMQGLGSGSISLFGSDLVKLRYLPKVATGKHIAAFAMTEPSGGSDVAAVATTAREDGDAYVLDGAKTFISNAGIAHHYVVFARTAPTGAKGLAAFVVDADIKGLRVTEKLDLLAPHPIGALAFDGCRVPKAQMLGRPGDGFKVGMATLDIFRTTVGAAALGFARRALDEALAYADNRQAFGQNLSEFQLVQDKLAQMALDVDTAALLIYRSAWAKDSGAARVTR